VGFHPLSSITTLLLTEFVTLFKARLTSSYKGTQIYRLELDSGLDFELEQQ
jgi:hypothetical protein